MKKYLIICTAVLLLIFSACGPQNPPDDGDGDNDPPEDEYQYVSMIDDKTFENGFVMRGLGNPIYNDPIETFGHPTDPGVLFQYEKTGLPAPSWHLCQWATRYPFHDIENASPYLPEGKFDYAFSQFNDHTFRYTNSSKSITVDTQTGEYSLALKASECFKYPRTAGQEWPHWFIERYIGSASNPPPQTSVALSESLKVRFDVRMNGFVDHLGSAANPGLHSGMCLFYLFVSNRNPTTKTFNDMLWFGIPVFDNRYVLTSEASFPDVGSKGSATEKWIFNIAGSEFFTLDYNLKTTDNEIIFGEWRSVDVELLPLIDKALRAAKEHGYMADAEWENLYINGMYFGYETPGTYDMDMSFRNVDIVSMIKV